MAGEVAAEVAAEAVVEAGEEVEGELAQVGRRSSRGAGSENLLRKQVANF